MSKQQQTCPTCDGSGKIEYTQILKDMKGKVIKTEFVQKTCSTCRGTGKI
jgi:hypothetical protein